MAECRAAFYARVSSEAQARDRTIASQVAALRERAAADGTPVRAIVGDDPVEFAETFAQAYSGKQWIDKERERLTKTIDNLAGDDSGKGVDS